MLRNECMFSDGSLGDPDARKELPERIKMMLDTERGIIEEYEVHVEGRFLVFDLVGAHKKASAKKTKTKQKTKKIQKKTTARRKPKK